MFILREGAAVASVAGKEVLRYGAGDYFGELALLEATRGLGRIVALYYRSSTSYQIHYHSRYLYF